MDSDIVQTDDRGAAVRIFDNNGIEHKLTVDWSGEIKAHAINEYPAEETERTEEEQKIIQRVRHNAVHAAHEETDRELIDSNWDPTVLEQAISALETLSGDQFRNNFEHYYRDLKNLPVDVPLERVVVMYKTLVLDGDTLADSSHTIVSYETDDSYEFSRKADTDGGDVVLGMPPMEIPYEFGEKFRKALVHHLKCQIRDVYLRMGEEPPEEYAVDGYGKPHVEGAPYML